MSTKSKGMRDFQLLRAKCIIHLRNTKGLSFEALAKIFSMYNPNVWKAYRRYKQILG
jgi:hypothetical protein